MYQSSEWRWVMEVGAMVRRARRAARLTQRALASRAGIDQAVIGRIETGAVQPRVDTLMRLLRACGWELTAQLAPSPDVDRTDLRRVLRMGDQERQDYFLGSNENMLRLFGESHAGS